MVNKLLEAEELAFLAELMTRENGNEDMLTIPLPQASPIMPLLSQARELNLVAHFQHHLLRFPVRLDINEDMRPELHIDGPEILEVGPTNRKWRFRPEESVRILDQHGNDSGLSLLDLSDSGLSLQSGDGGEPLAEQMKLQLEMPDTGDRFPLSARRVRELADGVAAYQLELQDARQEDQLRWFLFNQHPALRPRTAVTREESSPESAD